MAIPEYLAVVALLEDVPQSSLVRGQVGTVVEHLDDLTVLVEFADLEGQAYSIEAIAGHRLLTLHNAPVQRVA